LVKKNIKDKNYYKYMSKDMSKDIGDFVLIAESEKPGLIVSKVEDRLLISIDEYNGDYILLDYDNAEYINMLPQEQLSILANFGKWFYEQHKELYQEIIIKNIIE
jgi:hypothetical protein